MNRILVAGMILIAALTARVDLADGVYQVDVSMSGGSGRASIESPAQMKIQGGQAMAQIRFSSPNYDYMRVGEQTYYPVNTEGNSTFEIPVTVFDAPMEVVADTTAMSTPHEIRYTLFFDSSSVSGGSGVADGISGAVGYLAGAAAVILIGGGIVYMKGRKIGNVA